jgi:hypothetical protein
MPYKVKKVAGGGYKVTSPHHPGGFSKKPQSRAQAEAQRRAIEAHDGEGRKGK